MSPSLRDHGGLHPNAVHFLDVGHIWGKPGGLSECIDVGPRNLDEFGLRVANISTFRSVPFSQLPEPKRNVDFKVRYTVPNSGVHIEMFDNGTAQWFQEVRWVTLTSKHRVLFAFVNETACK